MRIPISVRIRGFFAKNKDAFWWNHFTDEEKELRSMDVWQLAKVINEVRVHNLSSTAEKLIVAEYLLKERIARIQSRPTWFAIWAGLLGIVGGVFLTSALQKPDSRAKCVCECQSGGAIDQNETGPILKSFPSVKQSSKPESQRIKNADKSGADAKP